MASKDRRVSWCCVKVYNARPFTACRPRLVVNLVSEGCITSQLTISVGEI
jgi:hypothetical protein